MAGRRLSTSEEGETSPLLSTTSQSGSSGGGSRLPVASGEKVFVWLVFTVMLTVAVGCVFLYASGVPYMDDWDSVVPALTGQQSVDLAWLWSQHNEHRIFLPRLVVLGLLKLSGGDFRIGAYFNVALLALMSAAAILAAQRVRGTTAFTDAVFPILLLHMRHFENIFWITQNQVIISVACSLFVLFAAVRYSAEENGTQFLACGIALLIIPFCGAFGLPIAVLSSLWLGYAALLRYRRRRRREGTDTAALAAIFLACLTPVVCVIYLIGLKRATSEHPSATTLLVFSANLLRFSMGIAEQAWLNYAQMTVLLFVPLAAGLLVWRWLRKPADRLRTAGVFLYLAGALAIILAIAGGRESNLFPSRYGLLCLPVLIATYFVFVLVETEDKLLPGRRLLTTLLFVPAVLLGVTSIVPMWNVSAKFMDARLRFEAGVDSQVPLPKLLAVYGTNMFLSREYLCREILGLTRAGIGPFRDYKPEADFTVEPLKLDPKTLQVACWDAGGKQPIACPVIWEDGGVTIPNSPDRIIQMMISVGNPGPRPLRGIRLHYRIDTRDDLLGATGFNLQWVRSGDQKLFSETEMLDAGWHPQQNPLVLYMDDSTDTLALFPRGLFRRVTIRGIDLLLPAAGEGGAK